MTTTSSREDRGTQPGKARGATTATAFTPPPKLRRRPALIAGGVATVCIGALLAAWAWTSTTHTEEVLAARSTIHQGEIIAAEDVQRVRISGDPAVKPLPASAYDKVVGQRAALDVAAGSLLTRESTSSAALPPKGQSVVGISLTGAQVPALPLRGGDRVRVVVTPGQDGGEPARTPEFSSAEVVDTRIDEVTGNTVVDVLVPYAEASVLAVRAATGNVALILDSAQEGE
jgi:hypothetical protein